MSCGANYKRFPEWEDKQAGGQRQRRQRGGASSDWGSSRNTVYIDVGELTKYTKDHIDNSPMFHPLEYNREFPTPVAGIYPTGIYYMNEMAKRECSKMPGCVEPGVVQRQMSVPKSGKESIVANLNKEMGM
jgi:hypothetical protein